MNTIETTTYFVGWDNEDAQQNAPFDSIEAATSFQEDNGGSIFMARTIINSDSLDVSDGSPNKSVEVFLPRNGSNPFPNGLDINLYLVGSNADAAEEGMPFTEEFDAIASAQDNDEVVYSAQAFIDLDSLEVMA